MALRGRLWTVRFLQVLASSVATSMATSAAVTLSMLAGLTVGGWLAADSVSAAETAASSATSSSSASSSTPSAKAAGRESKAVERGEIRGYYVESRSCQVYTGPCFANAEMALTGKDAVMAWGVADGRFDGVDLSGLNVVMVVRASETLGFGGLDAPESIKSLVIVDERANPAQREALIAFAKKQTGKAGRSIVRVETQPIEVSVDPGTLVGKVKAGSWVNVLTRKARPHDCICTNEVAYYPPLTSLKYFAAGVCTESEFKGRGLGNRWSLPNSRSAYLGEFHL